MDPPRAPPNAASFPFVHVDEKQHVMALEPGNWTLHEDLIFPAGYRIHAGPGVHLHLTHGASIISWSPLDFTGEENDPVLIDAPDSSGRGVVVLNAGDRSLLEHVVFRNLSNPSEQGWTLSGAVTFYQSPLEVHASTFEGNRSEDALNAVRSPFHIERSTFARTTSDAFDVDFGEGTVTDTHFMHIGNDAIDVSGTVVHVTGVRVDSAGDKGVSVGENSRAMIARSEFHHVNVGVAAKDLSVATLENVTVTDSRYGFAAYRKKPEFGGGHLQSVRAILRNIQTLYLRDRESEIMVSGTPVGTASTDVLKRVDPGS